MCSMPEGHRDGTQPALLLTCVETCAQVPRGEGAPAEPLPLRHRAGPQLLPCITLTQQRQRICQ